MATNETIKKTKVMNGLSEPINKLETLPLEDLYIYFKITEDIIQGLAPGFGNLEEYITTPNKAKHDKFNHIRFKIKEELTKRLLYVYGEEE